MVSRAGPPGWRVRDGAGRGMSGVSEAVTGRLWSAGLVSRLSYSSGQRADRCIAAACCWRSFTIDITEPKRTAQAREASLRKTADRERMLGTVLSALHDFAYSFDREGRFTFANQPLLELWGIGLDQVLGRNFQELGYPADVAEKLQRQVREVFESGQRLTDETPYTDPSGREGCYEYIFSPAFGADGCVDFVVGATRDITERKTAERSLRASEAEFRALAESMPQIVWTSRADGLNTYISQTWLDYSGMTSGESLDGWSEAFHPEDRARAWATWEQALATSGSYSLQCRLRRADGAYRWWLICAVPLRNDAGETVKWVGTCTDVDDLKRAELAVASANRALEESEQRFRSLLSAIRTPSTRWTATDSMSAQTLPSGGCPATAWKRCRQ